MRPLPVPENPGQALKASLPWLDRWIPRSECRLGGGTALVALWRHRHSTDINLACDSRVLEDSIRRNQEEIRTALRAMKMAGEILRWRSTARLLGWVTPLGPVSLVRSTFRAGVGYRPDYFESLSEIPIASIQEILSGKVLGRAIEDIHVPRRDAYDVACALLLAPEITRPIFDGLSPDELRGLWYANSLRGGSRPGPPILSPRFRALAKDPWKFSWEIFQRTMTLMEWRDQFEESRDDRSLGEE